MPSTVMLSALEGSPLPLPDTYINDGGMESHQYCRVDFPTIVISAFLVIITFSWLDTIRVIFRYFWIHDNTSSGSEVAASLMQSIFITILSLIVIYGIHEWAHFSFH